MQFRRGSPCHVQNSKKRRLLLSSHELATMAERRKRSGSILSIYFHDNHDPPWMHADNWALDYWVRKSCCVTTDLVRTFRSSVLFFFFFERGEENIPIYPIDKIEIENFSKISWFVSILTIKYSSNRDKYLNSWNSLHFFFISIRDLARLEKNIFLFFFERGEENLPIYKETYSIDKMKSKIF